jgi:hypothetical protein
MDIPVDGKETKMRTRAITSLIALLLACTAASASEAGEKQGLQLKLVVVKVVSSAYKTFKLPTPYKLVKNERGGYKFVAKGTPGYEKMEGKEVTEKRINKPRPGYPCVYYAVTKEGKLERFGVPGGYENIPGKETVVEHQTLQVQMTNTGEGMLLSPLAGNAGASPHYAMQLRVFDAEGNEVENRRQAITVPLAEARKYLPAEKLKGLRTYNHVGGGKRVSVSPRLLEKHVPDEVKKNAKWLHGIRKRLPRKYRPGSHPLTLKIFPKGKTLKYDLSKVPMQGAGPRMGLQVPKDGKYKVRVELIYPELGIKLAGLKIFSGKLVSNDLEIECRKYVRPKMPVRPGAKKPRAEIF